MNRINTSAVSDPTIQQPFTAKSLDFLQDSIKDALYGAIQSIIGDRYPSGGGGEVYILYGLEAYGTNQYYEGWLLFNNEVYYCPGKTTTTAFVNVPVLNFSTTPDPVADPVTFTDLVPRNVHDVKTIIIVDAVSGSFLIDLDDTTPVGNNPAGMMVDYPATTPPRGWLLCDGSSISTTKYWKLFAIFGYNYGGAGASFNLPDLRRRVSMGFDSTGGTDADFTNDVTKENSGRIGAKGGVNTHLLLSTESGLKDHIHVIAGDSDFGSTFARVANGGVGTQGNILSGGVNGGASNAAVAHENRMPYIVLAKIIKW